VTRASHWLDSRTGARQHPAGEPGNTGNRRRVRRNDHIFASNNGWRDAPGQRGARQVLASSTSWYPATSRSGPCSRSAIQLSPSPT
jgi:hypothetical protein